MTEDCRYVVSASADRTLKLWRRETGEEIMTLSGHDDRVWAVASSPDMRLIASASHDHTLKVWDVKKGQHIATFTGDAPMTACAVAPDSRRFLAGDAHGKVHFLRLEGIRPAKEVIG